LLLAFLYIPLPSTCHGADKCTGDGVTGDLEHAIIVLVLVLVVSLGLARVLREHALKHGYGSG
jgi:hypothetical protein